MTAATSKAELFVLIVNGWLEGMNSFLYLQRLREHFGVMTQSLKGYLKKPLLTFTEAIMITQLKVDT